VQCTSGTRMGLRFCRVSRADGGLAPQRVPNAAERHRRHGLAALSVNGHHSDELSGGNGSGAGTPSVQLVNSSSAQTSL